MDADANMDPYELEEEPPCKKRKTSNNDPLCRPQLNGWYTMHALEYLLEKDTAKSVASTAPTRWKGQGHGKPCVEQFLITDGEDAWKVYLEQFYVPPPPGYPGRRRQPY